MGSTRVTAPAPPPAPTPVDPYQSSINFTRAMLQMQPEMLAAEQQFRPQYLDLELADINRLMQGAENQMGLLGLEQLATRQASQSMIDALRAQRDADISDVEALGGRASAAFMQANPALAAAMQRAESLQGIQGENTDAALMGMIGQGAQQIGPMDSARIQQQIDSLTAEGVDPVQASQIVQTQLGEGLQQAGMAQLQAGAGEQGIGAAGLDYLNRGGELTPLQARNAEQQARMAGVARGRELGQGSIYQEMQNRMAQEMDLERQNTAMGAGLLGQQFGMEQQRLGMAGGIYGQDMQRAAQNAAMQQQASLANQQAGLSTQGMNMQGGIAGLQALMGLSEMDQRAALANQQAGLQQQGMGIQGLLGLGQLQQQRLGQERGFALDLVGAQQRVASDPFQAILGRPSTAPDMGMASTQYAGGMASQPMGPNLFDPNAGINLALQQNQNMANYQSSIFGSQAALAGAQSQAKGAMMGGLFQGLGSLAGAGITKYCWVAREVYGEENPSWLRFREWMLNDAPGWFRALYIGYGERFAAFIKDKPKVKRLIKKWMDGRIN